MIDTPLPVDEIRDNVLQHITKAHPKPLILSAPTGSGKSTRLPLWIASVCDADKPVLVVEPRRMACKSLARYLAHTRGEHVGASIGYVMRFDERRSVQTRVLFATPGLALRLLDQDACSSSSSFGAVILDEFHERGWEIDLIAAILMHRQKKRPLPLIVMSATLDVAHLAKRFHAKILEANGRTFPVTTMYLGDVPCPSKDRLTERVTQAVAHIDAQDPKGQDILIFLPGKGEIMDCIKALSADTITRHMEILPMYAGLPERDFSRIFEQNPGEKRRIYVATNVAETSITLPGVTWVIDSGLARMMMHRASRSALVLSSIAQDAMTQRTGRAGRVAPGKCLRLWSESFRAPESTAPEIERIALDDMILRAAMCGLDGEDFDQAPWITPPPDFAIQDARQRLKRQGALNTQARLTQKGRNLASIPAPAIEASLLCNPPRALAGVLADLVALLQQGRGLIIPLHRISHDQREHIMEKREELFAGCTNEVTELLTALRSGDARIHGLRKDSLTQARTLAASFRVIVHAKPMRPDRDTQPLPPDHVLAQAILERWPEAGFVLRPRAQKQKARATSKGRAYKNPFANGAIELLVEPFVAQCKEDRQEHTPQAGILLAHTWMGDRTGTGVHGHGSMLLPAPKSTLAACGLGVQEVAHVTLERRSGKTVVVGEVRRTLAGVLLSVCHEDVQGAELCRAVATLTIQNRLFKGFGDIVADDLHLWKLLTRWEPTLEQAHWTLDDLRHEHVPSIHDHLSQRMEVLGVESSEDLELIQGEDLRPKLAERLGSFEGELESFAKEFPRQWTHQGARYTCTVSPHTRRVLLEPTNKAATKAKEPNPSILPRFRGFRVEYKQASRKITIRT